MGCIQGVARSSFCPCRYFLHAILEVLPFHPPWFFSWKGGWSWCLWYWDSQYVLPLFHDFLHSASQYRQQPSLVCSNAIETNPWAFYLPIAWWSSRRPMTTAGNAQSFLINLSFSFSLPHCCSVHRDYPSQNPIWGCSQLGNTAWCSWCALTLLTETTSQMLSRCGWGSDKYLLMILTVHMRDWSKSGLC